MAKKKKKGSIFHRKDGRWEGRYVIGYDEKGYPKTKSVTAKSKTACQQKLNELKKSMQSAAPEVQKDLSFGEWLDSWYQKQVKPRIRPTTQQRYENCIYNHLSPKLGGVSLKALSTGQLQLFFNELRSKGRLQNIKKLGKGLSPQSVQSCYAVCKMGLNAAVAEGHLAINPILGCKLPTEPPREMQVLSQEEVQRFLIQAQEEGFYELFLLELSTGLRRGEILALCWEDLDFTSGALQINKQVYPVHGKVTVAEPKTSASIRSIVLPPPLLELLRERKKESHSPWIFPSPRKPEQPIDPGFIRKKLHQILERAQCKDLRFHDLRHTFATMSLERGMDIKTLSTIVGHSTTDTTLNVYSHSSDKMKRDAALKIDREITGNEAPEAAYPENTTQGEPMPFQAVKPKRRRPGTGCVSQINDHLWEGRYSPIWPDGKKHCRDVYAKTEAECEEKLAELIKEMNAEIAAAKEAKKAS